MASVIDMALLAHLDLSASSAERRSTQRRKLRLESSGDGATPVLIHDLSEEGMLVEAAGALATGEQLDIMIPEMGAARATVMWSSGRYFGCRFDRAISTAAVSGALLRSPAMPSGQDRQHALAGALAELRSLAETVEQIADRVDAVIEQLSKRQPHG